MKNKKIKRFFSSIGMLMFILVCFTSPLKATSGEFDIEDYINIFGSELKHLEIDTIFTDLLRNLGDFIRSFLAPIVDSLHGAFKAVATWDIFNLSGLQLIEENLKNITLIVLIIALVLCALVQLFSIKEKSKFVYNIMVVMVIVPTVTLSMNFLNDMKNDGVEIADLVVGTSSGVTVSEQIYKDNTVDIWTSLKKGKVMTLSEIGDIDLNIFDHSERMSKDQFIEKQYYDEDGNVKTKDLADGLWGVGDVRYYRYHVDYYVINSSLFVLLLVYFIGILKIINVVWNATEVYLASASGLLIARGFFNFENIGAMFKEYGGALISVVWIYFTMMVFSLIAPDIMKDTTLNAYWFLPPLVLYSIGMGIASGGSRVLRMLGLDDGRQGAMSTLLSATMLGRGIGKAKRKVSSSIGNATDNIKSGYGKVKDKLQGFDKKHAKSIMDGPLPLPERKPGSQKRPDSYFTDEYKKKQSDKKNDVPSMNDDDKLSPKDREAVLNDINNMKEELAQRKQGNGSIPKAQKNVNGVKDGLSNAKSPTLDSKAKQQQAQRINEIASSKNVPVSNTDKQNSINKHVGQNGSKPSINKVMTNDYKNVAFDDLDFKSQVDMVASYRGISQNTQKYAKLYDEIYNTKFGDKKGKE